jgi:hypothetical protein
MSPHYNAIILRFVYDRCTSTANCDRYTSTTCECKGKCQRFLTYFSFFFFHFFCEMQDEFEFRY